MNYLDIINKVSQEISIPPEVVDTAYKSYWKFIKQTVQSLPLKDDISEEDFIKLRTNFNIPSLGKLCVTWDRLVGCKNRFKIIKKLRENVQ